MPAISFDVQPSDELIHDAKRDPGGERIISQLPRWTCLFTRGSLLKMSPAAVRPPTPGTLGRNPDRPCHLWRSHLPRGNHARETQRTPARHHRIHAPPPDTGHGVRPHTISGGRTHVPATSRPFANNTCPSSASPGGGDSNCTATTRCRRSRAPVDGPSACGYRTASPACSAVCPPTARSRPRSTRCSAPVPRTPRRDPRAGHRTHRGRAPAGAEP